MANGNGCFSVFNSSDRYGGGSSSSVMKRSFDFDVSRVVSTSVEVRPFSVSLLPLISC